MKSKVDKKDYCILLEGDRFPFKLNRKKMDRALSDLIQVFSSTGKALDSVCNETPDIWYFICKMAFDLEYYYNWRTNEYDLKGRVHKALEDLEELQEQLKTHDDEIPLYEEIVTLRDLGYKEDPVSRHRLWENIREDTDEQEIVEEILLLDEPVRRLRTTLWEKTSYGKSSKSIRYKKLPIGKKLAKAIENTKKEAYRDR